MVTFNNLTVGEALELNRIAKETCSIESTSQLGDNYEIEES